MKKTKKLRSIILPNKSLNYFIITIIILGILSGSIFTMILNESDKSNVILQIQNFFQNISKESIENGLALRNSLIINYLFIGAIWILGFTLIGVICNIFLVYLKGFLVGFSITSILLTYGYKGIPASLLYSLCSQILNIIAIIIIAIYSLMFSYDLFLKIRGKKTLHTSMLKKYLIILMIVIIISFISSLVESYLFPYLLKIIIKLYVK